MSRAFEVATCDICVDLSIALCSLEVDTFLFCHFLKSWPLPFWKPSLRIWQLSRIKWVIIFWILGLLCSLLWNKYFSSTFHFLSWNTSCLDLLHLLWKCSISQFLETIFLCHIVLLNLLCIKQISGSWHYQILLNLRCLSQIFISQQIEV